jgi:hypothetical protein
MNHNDIFEDIKKTFSNLWKTKQRGDSLEIITPYATTNDKFISVFLTKQGTEYIITDGGWINNGIYNNHSQNEESCFLKVLYHYQNSFNIKEVESPDGVMYYYLKVVNPIDIPSRIFDLSSFVQSVVSVSEISFESKIEKESQSRFVSKANEYLKSFIQPKKIKFNRHLNPDKKEIKFNAIYHNTSKDLTLINYITGSSNFYFSNSIFRTNTLFEMADETLYKNHIVNKLSIIDTNAKGYVPEKLSHYLFHLEKQTHSKMINWSEKEKLQAILN